MTVVLSEEARGLLLRVARSAIESDLAGRAMESTAPSVENPELRQAAGAFVSLHRRADDDLRGCVGYVEARWPLIETVARAAVAAARLDTRFPPVALVELPALRIDVSVLEPPSPIRPEEVVVGEHGLIVERESQRGLLLPQVPVEAGWDVERFLGATCRKAGLPVGAWRDPQTRLLAFRATVFGER